MSDEEPKPKLSRRNFLKYAGATIAAGSTIVAGKVIGDSIASAASNFAKERTESDLVATAVAQTDAQVKERELETVEPWIIERSTPLTFIRPDSKYGIIGTGGIIHCDPKLLVIITAGHVIDDFDSSNTSILYKVGKDTKKEELTVYPKFQDVLSFFQNDPDIGFLAIRPKPGTNLSGLQPMISTPDPVISTSYTFKKGQEFSTLIYPLVTQANSQLSAEVVCKYKVVKETANNLVKLSGKIASGGSGSLLGKDGQVVGIMVSRARMSTTDDYACPIGNVLQNFLTKAEEEGWPEIKNVVKAN